MADDEDMNATATPAPGTYAAFLRARSDRARAAAADRPRYRGRFVRTVTFDEMDTTDAYVIDANGDAHGVHTCPAIVGDATPGSARDASWICPVCVRTDPGHARARAFIRDHGYERTGTNTCDECNVTKPVNQFPTMTVVGWNIRGIVCRPCERAARSDGRTMDSHARTYARYVVESNLRGAA